MILIAHRGLTDGPDKAFENHPKKIKNSLADGFHCEIDVWYKDERWYLGHDEPVHAVDYEFLEQPRLWVHAKNLEALYVLGANKSINFFWHQEDDFTLTSMGDIWTYPGKPLMSNSINVMPEWNDPNFEKVNFNCMGICSDHVRRLRAMMPIATGQIY